MKKISYILTAGLALGSVLFTGCSDFLDINTDPDNIVSTNAPLPQLLTAAQVNLGFEGGSDKFRYASILTQQFSGQASPGFQTFEYNRFNITGSDQNNLWSSMFATTLSDLELIIKNATASGSPHYSGVAKIMKAYQYQLAVDMWGNIPYAQALMLDQNTQPAYDEASAIYTNLITLLNEGITEVKAETSALSPGTNSVIFPGAFATTKKQWEKLANTLKLRIYIHYSKVDPAFMTQQINTLLGSNAVFMEGNEDSFQMAFLDEANRRNPIHAYEISRPNYLFPGADFVDLMNSKLDPRRSSYFTAFPYGSTNYKGVKAGDPGTVNYSRMHTYLRGTVSGTPTPNADGGILATALTYNGTAPIRMLTYAEYCFIRAEAAARGANGVAQEWFSKGITASMKSAGVADAAIATYLTANGTLAGASEAMIKQIIEEKYVALYGVAVEPWTDYRRTGYPALTLPANPMEPAVPRSLYYPQSEVDTNPINLPAQKTNQQVRIFWDKQ
ncbi:hypothetical protein DSL64_23620 [Dyadobacter luteus]|jgi:hypothetical protein|uniref:SusD/RagB family nutrient-binding outer membrane lipoprotein n=1 Tax=Dyadobacter luteus TaxID=2259619 RepID=A0A3D8Y887_9BACT|nr:SusD/RagB family nutrient-binding outer membrane lipoprotein [Dyadobacter luteus]REA57518.1 hypothetical protein DSL64_23620 [Dyadobacter luteus]